MIAGWHVHRAQRRAADAVVGPLLAPAQGAVLPAGLDETLLRIVAAILAVVVGVFLSKYVVRLLQRPVERRVERESIAQIILRSLRIAIVVLAIGGAADLIGFAPTDILLSVTVFSAVLGLVLAPVIGNVINGLFVLADQPYEIGDMIELQNGTKGFVDDITLRYTKVFTIDNTFTVIPNASIREQQIVNYSAEDSRIRLALPLLVTYESDIQAARALFERAARECESVIDGGPDIRIGPARYPAKPTAYIDEHADSGVRINLRYWAIKPYRLLTVRSEVQTAIREALAETDADVEIAYPHRQLVLDDELGVPEDGIPPREGATGDDAVGPSGLAGVEGDRTTRGDGGTDG